MATHYNVMILDDEEKMFVMLLRTKSEHSRQTILAQLNSDNHFDDDIKIEEDPPFNPDDIDQTLQTAIQSSLNDNNNNNRNNQEEKHQEENDRVIAAELQ
eukprot:154590_1